jgi:hypothetical protein
LIESRQTLGAGIEGTSPESALIGFAHEYAAIATALEDVAIHSVVNAAEHCIAMAGDRDLAPARTLDTSHPGARAFGALAHADAGGYQPETSEGLDENTLATDEVEVLTRIFVDPEGAPVDADFAEALRVGQGHRRGAPTPEFFGIHLIERPDQDRRVAGINRLRLRQRPRVDSLNGESEENEERERERTSATHHGGSPSADAGLTGLNAPIARLLVSILRLDSRNCQPEKDAGEIGLNKSAKKASPNRGLHACASADSGR